MNRSPYLKTHCPCTIALVGNPVHHQRSKHIDIKYHFIRDECRRDKINVVYKPTSDMVADIFTKPVSKYKLNQYIDVLLGTTD